MKRNRLRFKHILAILLCVMLMADYPGLAAFADETSSEPAGVYSEEEALASEPEASAQETEAFPDNETSKDDRVDGEGSSEISTEGQTKEPAVQSGEEETKEDDKTPADEAAAENGDSAESAENGDSDENRPNSAGSDAAPETAEAEPVTPEQSETVKDAANGTTETGETQSISYVDADGNTQTAENVIMLTGDRTDWRSGWYAVSASEPVEISERVMINGHVHLILCDGAKLSIEGGIELTQPVSLTIYGQSRDGYNMGDLVIKNVAENAAGIGGSRIGGTAGDLIVNGGGLDIYGGTNGAGIGGGRDGNGGSVTINGGTVTAVCGCNAAGIGGGFRGRGGTVTINGGRVYAYGDIKPTSGGAGIGNGEGFGDTEGSGGDGCTVVINDGEVFASGGRGAAGIGSGFAAFSICDITINGGSIEAYGGNNYGGNDGGPGIGGGYASGSVFVTIAGGSIKACGGTVSEGGTDGSGISGGNITITGGSVNATGKGTGAGINVASTMGADGTITISGGKITAKCDSDGVGIGGSDAGCSLVMHLTEEAEFICSDSYSNIDVSIAERHYLKNEKTRMVYSGVLEDPSELNGSTLIPVSNPVHKIDIAVQNGSVKGPTMCEEGDAVSFTLNPDEYCELVSLTVSGEDRTGEVIYHTYNYTMPGEDVVMDVLFLTPWTQLQRRLDDGGKITLERRYEDKKHEGALVVPEDVTVELDMNGYSIDRDLREGNPINGGSVILVRGTLILKNSGSGGEICGGNSVSGGGVYVDAGKFTMEKGAKIVGNSAAYGGGVFVENGMFTMEKGAVVRDNKAESKGGGVFLHMPGNTGWFTMEKDASIRFNTANEGGGVYLDTGLLRIHAGATIEHNTATGTIGAGGGLYIYGNGSCRMQDGAIIRYNTAKQSGGGVYMTGEFVMEGGSISKNTAEEKVGGGICVKSGTLGVGSGILQIEGGSITENKAGENGGGVFLDKVGIFRLKGDPVIGSNILTGAETDNNVYLENLENGKTITVFDSLSENASISVTTEATPAADEPVVITDHFSGRGTAANFFSDDRKYRVVLSETGEAELVERTETVVNGVTGSFNDKIKLNYYFYFSAEVLADEGAYVTITNESNTDAEPVTLHINSREEIPLTKDGYKCSIALVAKEAGDTITARVFDGQGNQIEIKDSKGNDQTENGVKCSLMQYFDWLAEHGKDDKEKAVGAAAKDYCTAARIYFDYNAEGLEVSSAVDKVDPDTLDGYISEREGDLPEGVSIKGITAMLQADNTLRLYYDFKGVDPEGLRFMIDRNEAKLKQRKDGMYYIAPAAGEYSNHLQDTHTYTVSDGVKSYSITASVLTYARSCAKKDVKKESDLGKALYLYNQAAVAAFGQ